MFGNGRSHGLVVLRGAAVALATTLAAGLGACQSGGGAGGGGAAGASGEPYAQSFSSGRYQQAYTQATAEAQSGDERERERAALVAGMSASAMGKPADAARWLSPLVNSRDPQVAGRASWTLAKMAEDNGQSAEAGTWYARAARSLSGDDAARCALAGGDALRRAGDTSGASDLYALGARKAEDAGLRAQIEQRQGGASGGAVAATTTMSNQDAARAVYASQAGFGSGRKYAGATSLCDKPGVMGSGGGATVVGGSSGSLSSANGAVCQTVTVLPAPGGSAPAVVNAGSPSRYVIQLGAFADQQRASQQLRTVQAAAARSGTPSPQLVPTTDSRGQSLFAVRLGSYSSREAAASDLQRLGLQGVVMASRQ